MPTRIIPRRSTLSSSTLGSLPMPAATGGTIAVENNESSPADRLRAMIIDGHFMPNQRLIEADLATSLGVNRANIRTALARLEQEGLVISERNRGARVRLYSAGETVEIIEARAVLEALVARKAAERITAEGKKNLRELIRQMTEAARAGDLLQYSDYNGRFHTEIGRIANHATATRLLMNLRSQAIRFQFRAILLPGRVGESLEEHKLIAKALASGDSDQAERVMRMHLQRVSEALRRAMTARNTA